MKAVFQTQDDRKRWLAEVVASPIFQEACVFAIAEYSRGLGNPGDELRMRGAVEILKVLQDLPVTHKKQEEMTKLNYATNVRS